MLPEKEPGHLDGGAHPGTVFVLSASSLEVFCLP